MPRKKTLTSKERRALVPIILAMMLEVKADIAIDVARRFLETLNYQESEIADFLSEFE